MRRSTALFLVQRGFAAAIGPGLSGCESARDAQAERALEVAVERAMEERTGQQVRVDANKRGIIIESGEGADELRVDTAPGKLPPNWPSEIPIYPDARLSLSMSVGAGWTVSFESDDPAARVIAFYKTELASMDQRASMDMGGKKTLMWVSKAEPMHVTLSVAEDDRTLHTTTTIAVSREQAR